MTTGGIYFSTEDSRKDRRPFSRTKTGIQTPYCPLGYKNIKKHRYQLHLPTFSVGIFYAHFTILFEFL
nr:MAG TPA: hypothetical protein [Caudoviricetes sp.]